MELFIDARKKNESTWMQFFYDIGHIGTGIKPARIYNKEEEPKKSNREPVMGEFTMFLKRLMS